MVPCTSRLRLLFAVTLAAGLAGTLAGCGSPGRRHRPPPGDGPVGLPPVVMTADGTYFAGQLGAELTLARGRLGGRGPRPNREYAPMLRPHAIGETPPGADLGPRRPGSALLDAPAGPALTLRLRLTNRGTVPLTVTILECSSALGDFAVRPERVDLAPGQAAEVDPMISQLGVVAARIDVLLRLQAGDRKESQTLTLQPLQPEGDAAP